MRDSHAIGCLVVDAVSPTMWWIRLWFDSALTQLAANCLQVSESKVVCISKETEDIACPVVLSNTNGHGVSNAERLGIRQIWISGSCRRQNVASRMVDCARRRFSLGSLVDRRVVAFSQPTQDGLRFAKSYVPGDKLLVY